MDDEPRGQSEMAINVNGSSVINYQVMQRVHNAQKNRENSEVKQDASSDNTIENSGDEDNTGLLQRFTESVDEMSAAISQFRNRRDINKKSSNAEDANFFEVLDDEAEIKFVKVIEVMKNIKGAELPILLTQVRSLFPDDSDLVLILRKALKEKLLDEITKANIKNLLTEVLIVTNSKRLKAGINIAIKARLFSKPLALNPTIVRESYRDFIESQAHEIDIYQDWISTYGLDKRNVVVNFMEDALLADFDSVDASCNDIEFGYLMGRIGQIKIIRSCEQLFTNQLMNNTYASGFVRNEKLWMYFLFGVLQQPIELKCYFYEILSVSQSVINGRQKSNLLNLLRIYCDRLPINAFYSPDGRDVMKTSFSHFASELLILENSELRRSNSQ